MPPPSQSNKDPIYDGQTDFSGGMDSSRSPELISPNQISLGVNVTMRNGYPATRPQFNRLTLDFAGDLEIEMWWNTHYFQGASYFNVNGAYPTIIASVGGRIFNLQPQGQNFEVTDITPNKADGSLDRNSSLITKAYFCQADVYLVIQDGQSLPFIFDGSTLRRSNPAIPEVPVGTVMAYGQARLTVASGNQFLVGDINGGATNVLSFTETTYLNGGGAFILPMNMGNVTGMIFTAQQDTNTGQGTLLVFGETGVISVNLLIPRTQWQDSQIVTVTLTNIGTLSDRSLFTVNADIIFRSQDGIRTYRDARAEFGQYSLGNYGKTALSYEIQEYLDTDALVYQPYISGTVFDNRYLMTSLPVLRNGIGVPVFQSLAVLDFIPVSALRYNQPPVFDGFWTGLDFYQLLQGQFASGIRCLSFVRGVDNVGNQQLELWEITKIQGNDNGFCPIACAIETKSFTFGSPLAYKQLEYLRHWADQLQDRIDWTLRLRPDQYPGWILWQQWTYKAPQNVCLNESCSVPNYQPQYRAGRNSIMAPEAIIADGSRLWTVRTGFSFQFRLEWAGVARLTKLIASSIGKDIPKLDYLEMAPPENPITAVVALAPPATTFYNALLVYTCPSGTTGNEVIVPAGTFSSNVSMAAADALALAYAQANAFCVGPFIPPTINNAVYSVAKALDNSGYYIYGNFTGVGAGSINRIAKLGPTGALIATFNNGGAGFTSADNVPSAKLQIQADGKILVPAYAAQYNGSTYSPFPPHTWRLNTDGSSDAAYNSNATATVGNSQGSIKLLPSGKMLQTGQWSNNTALIRFNADGTMDNTFSVPTGNNVSLGVDVDPSGLAVWGWNNKRVSGGSSGFIAKTATVNGGDDSTFPGPTINVSGFNAGTPQVIRAHPLGGFLVACGNGTAAATYNGVAFGTVLKINEDGTLDTTYSIYNGYFDNTATIIYDIQFLSDGSAILCGTFKVAATTFSGVVKLTPTGTRDLTFQPTFDGVVNGIWIESNDNIMCGGNFNNVNSTARSKVCRLDSNGNIV